jgi:DNA polymerase-1
MAKRLFLLDGMALVYRAHFAFIARPILTSRGVNTSALFGFTQTLLDILSNQQPTHLAVAFDTEAPTARHKAYPDYKATREAMPEDLEAALPHVRRMIEAFNIPLLLCDGYEADDIIGTLARRAEASGYETFMVTPDKDFGQLVDAHTFIYKPGRAGGEAEILGVAEIQRRWNIQRPDQVIDVLALMGDSSDNVPGVPGVGEKTAMKLIAQFGSVDNLLQHIAELKGRVKDSLDTHRDLALLSKRLVTIQCDAPCPVDLDSLRLRPPDEARVKTLLIEFEFNSIGRRLFGDEFKAGRGFQPGPAKDPASPQAESADRSSAGPSPPEEPVFAVAGSGTGSLEVPPGRSTDEPTAVELGVGRAGLEPPAAGAKLRTLVDVPHHYKIAATAEQRNELIRTLQAVDRFGLKVEASSADPKAAQVVGLAFATEPRRGWYAPMPDEAHDARRALEAFRPVLESERAAKIGHDLKSDLSILRWHGVSVAGRLCDVLIAHSLIEPELRHALEYLAEACLGYTLAGAAEATQAEQLHLGGSAPSQAAERATERADIALQVWSVLEPLLAPRRQDRVLNDIEAPLIRVLVDMEHEGIRVEAGALSEFAILLGKEMDAARRTIWQAAGREFNLDSPRQLGEVLFEVLKLSDQPRKTRTGQYATDEQTLLALAADHEIVQRLLEYRAAAKLKSTYADALPAAIWPATGRVHTTYQQVMTATGRLSSQDPNLQNIPIRTERGREIRKAFVPRDDHYALLSADYSQIELRIIAGLSRERGLLEAFERSLDIHTATAARVYGVAADAVTPEMRRTAKMVNYGIAYGISAFGLAQRLGVSRREGAAIIDEYFRQFPGIRKFMDDTIAFAREHGFVETVTGRRRYLRDIRSSNNTVRAAAERNAINAPIQGTAADMIKLAMVNIHAELTRRQCRSKMLLQVHDELVFDLHRDETGPVRTLVEEKMRTAIELEVPIVVETGIGPNWLAAH